MADGERLAVGLSVGATNLAAAPADQAVTRKPVLTSHRAGPPEVGVGSENANLTEQALVITEFGEPAGIVAAAGSAHRGEALLADGLRTLAYTATGGRALPQVVAVAHPAHWGHAEVDALRTALSRVPEWSDGPEPVPLVADAAAALIALQANPGVPTRGIIAVCDFGGSGTSLTLVDAANDYQPVAPTLRYPDFSGDSIDQALLTHVVDDLSTAGSFDTSGTSAIGSLTRLWADCRGAKEELSSTTTTTLTADLPGYRGDIRLTRTELDDVIRQPLDGFLDVVQQTLQRSETRAADLVAVASVGGGASIPAVTTMLTERLGVPVITAPRPYLTPAIGAAIRAARSPGDTGETALAPAAAGFTDATTIFDPAPESSTAPELAWSEEADDDSDIVPGDTGEYPDGTIATAIAWYRRVLVAIVVGAVLLALAVVAVVLIALRHNSGGAPTTPTTSVSTPAPPPPPPPTTEAPPPPPPPQTVTVTPEPPPPPPQTVTVTPEPPPSEYLPPQTVTVTPEPPPPPPQYPLFPRREQPLFPCLETRTCLGPR